MNRQITLAARPEGQPKESDFALVEGEVPAVGSGEVLVRSQWLSLDPYMRGRMSTARSYAASTAPWVASRSLMVFQASGVT